MFDDDRDFFHALADIFGNILDKDEAGRKLLHESVDRCVNASKDDTLIADVQAELLAGVEEAEAVRKAIPETRRGVDHAPTHDAPRHDAADHGHAPDPDAGR